MSTRVAMGTRATWIWREGGSKDCQGGFLQEVTTDPSEISLDGGF